MNAQHIQHLYWRAGFGILPNELHEKQGKSKKTIVNELFSDSKSITPLRLDISDVEGMVKEIFKTKDKKQMMALRKANRELVKDYNIAWVERLMYPKELLRERMTLFWSNHFVVKDARIRFVQDFNNTLREFALGNFGDFVKAISKQAAMLKYLNNKQNKKQSPNENFARELMELFTLGEGNYTEEDIKESARAFTGYFHNIKGEFLIRERQHDDEPKTFFSKTGNFDGDDIIDIILEQKQCARFVSEKIYQYFVNENINSNHIEEMVDIFYGNYNIEKLMRFVFSSDWFYNDENIGTKIKSPIDFLVGMNYVVPMEFKKKKIILFIQNSLGQVLLNPPNVAGWKGGKSWIDSNTILMRMRYPSILLNNAEISTEDKNGFGDALGDYMKQSKKKFNLLKVETDWEAFGTNFKNVKIDSLKDYLLAISIHPETKLYLETLRKSSLKDYCIQLMSLPEYQMC